MSTTLQSGEIDLVVCGRFNRIDESQLKPDSGTEWIISELVDRLRRRELHPYVSVNFCNCGNAEEHGLSITVLPEKVRYLDLDEETIDRVIDRHVESVVRSGGT